MAAIAVAIAAVPPRVSEDSVLYFALGRGVAAGEGPRSNVLHVAAPVVPAPLGLWPPGYPYVLGLATKAGLSERTAAAVVNAVALMGLALALLGFLSVNGASRAASACGVLLAIGHPFITAVFGYAWSEGCFIALTYVAIWLLARGAKDGELRWMLFAGVAAGSAALFRYVGAILVAYCVAVAVVSELVRKRADRLGRALIRGGCVLAGAAPLAVVSILDNARWYGSATGLPRLRVAGLLDGPLRRASELVDAVGLLGSGSWVALVLAGCVLAFRRMRREPAGSRACGMRPGVVLLVGWAAVYCVGIWFLLRDIVTNQIDARLLSPVAPAVVIASVLVLEDAMELAFSHRFMAFACAALAVASQVRAGVVRALRPAATARHDTLAAWAASASAPDSLIVASRGWALVTPSRFVLMDGAPEMPELDPDGVVRFLDGPGARFRTVHVVFRPEGTVRPSHLPAYVSALATRAWRVGPAERHGDALVLTGTRG